VRRHSTRVSADGDVAHSFFFQAEDGIRDYKVTGVQTCALPILLTNLCHAWLRKFLEFLLSRSGDLCELAFTLWTRLRHLAERCIGKDNISRDIALVRDLSAQRAQTLEKFFIAFDFASPWGADLLCWRLDRLG